MLPRPPHRIEGQLPLALVFGLVCIQAHGSWAVGSTTENLLVQADLAALKLDAPPPEPWETGDGYERVGVRVAKIEREPTIWVELRDGSTAAPANLRQVFRPLMTGRFSFRLLVAGDNAADIGIYLGTGTVRAGGDRVIDIKTDDVGRVRLGSRASRRETPLLIQPEVVTHLWVTWQPAASGTLDVRLGTIDTEGAETEVAQFAVPDPAPITALRITTDISSVAGHFYVTDLVLMGR